MSRCDASPQDAPNDIKPTLPNRRTWEVRLRVFCQVLCPFSAVGGRFPRRSVSSYFNRPKEKSIYHSTTGCVLDLHASSNISAVFARRDMCRSCRTAIEMPIIATNSPSTPNTTVELNESAPSV